ncbi:MAG: hypothetical protein JO002_01105 [Burkholderiaceae bacterium]|nr:hypothetical protein [Burkholderiaceae bacterium]
MIITSLIALLAEYAERQKKQIEPIDGKQQRSHELSEKKCTVRIRSAAEENDDL